MDKGDIAFVDKKLSTDEKIKICDEIIYFIDGVLSEDPRKVNLKDIAHRFRIDTLQSKVKSLKKQII